jgi:hypothetical protein
MTTDLERLSVSGSDEEKRLLAAARAVAVPPRMQEEVRRAVEERVRRGRRRWLLGVFGVLAAASAAAQGTGVLERVFGRGTPPPAPVLASRPTAPVVVPLPVPEAAPVVPAPSVRAGRPPVVEKVVVEKPVIVQQPGLDLPTLLREPADPPAPPPPPSPGLVIARAGRASINLAVKDDSIAGSVRGVPVSLSVGAKSLTGRIGDDAVLIHVFGTREASGTVGGRELEFAFTPTDRGLILRASLADVSGRVELDGDRLSFLPGCALTAARSGAYAGRCADGTALQVALPPSFWRLPERTRLIVLGMLLLEPESELERTGPSLFPLTR